MPGAWSRTFWFLVSRLKRKDVSIRDIDHGHPLLNQAGTGGEFELDLKTLISEARVKKERPN